MFLNHFNLTQQPFTEKPPVEWLLRDPRMDQGLSRLAFFREEGTIALLLGNTGIGKSTLLRLFMKELPQNRYQAIYLHLTRISETAFLRLIVTLLGEAPKFGKDRLFMQIVERVKKNDRTTFLIIDEAHMIDPGALTALRLLVSSLENDLPLKIILSGQVSLKNTLKRSSHSDLVHRICVRYTLKALTQDQTGAYIDHRMSLAGGSKKVFEIEAKQMIYDYTSGIPRLINNVALSALINAASKNQTKITKALIDETMDEIKL